MTSLQMFYLTISKYQKRLQGDFDGAVRQRHVNNSLISLTLTIREGPMFEFCFDHFVYCIAESKPQCINYTNVIYAHWLDSNLDKRIEIKNRNDKEKLGVLVLGVAGAHEVVIRDLGNTVFPLLHCFKWIAAKNSIQV